MMKVLFLHGWQSVPGSVKPTYLAQHGHTVLNPKLSDDDFEEAVRIAQAEYDQHQPDVIVGSSRGGAVAMNMESGDTPLVLLCPAWKRWGTARTVKPEVTILHSRADDVIPFAESEELIAQSNLPADTLVEVGSDHRLADPESLKAMLRACDRLTEWGLIAQKFDAGMRESAIQAARRRLQRPNDADWRWLTGAIKDDRRKRFVAAVFSGYPVSRRLFQPFLWAAINESNPSTNRQFVEPCIASFGHRAVNEHLLNVVEGSNDVEIAGAVAALYWAQMPLCFVGDVPQCTLEYATPESRDAFLALNDIWQRKRETYLRVFVNNQDVTVRQQVIPTLNLDESAYPDDMKPLVQRAVEVARSHPDDYIRHRIEVQLGNERLLRPIPARSTPSTE